STILDGNLHVLVVEDNLLNQMLIEKYLKDWKCNVELAENGLIAIRKLEKMDFDILLTQVGTFKKCFIGKQRFDLSF
ncbi:MAG: response regulator, partial [Bacteroidota bacterium]